MEIKICGITSLEDALAAVHAGATMLGYNFYRKSKRYLPPPVCVEIQSGLAHRGIEVLTVGIFVNESTAVIERILAECAIDLAQLSGDEPRADLVQLGDRGFKAIRPRNPDESRALLRELPLRAAPPAILVDTFIPGAFGGTGHTGDWHLAAHLAEHTDLLLAGGLSPENVAHAIEIVRPWGVDVATGVERAPGLKDPEKMKRFAANVQTVTDG